VDDVVNAIAAIDQTNISIEEDVTVVKLIAVGLGYKASCPLLGGYSKGITYSVREVIQSDTDPQPVAGTICSPATAVLNCLVNALVRRLPEGEPVVRAQTRRNF
jgi:hypothetical protein